MNIIITGCEYSGATTLANGVARWANATMGGTQEAHDHFKLPNIACYRQGVAAEPLTDEELTQISSWSPKLKEMAQRQSITYHLPNTCDSDDYILVGYHVEDAVYAPMFFGYGGATEPQGGFRWKWARHIESRFQEQAPDTIIAFVTASQQAIAERMSKSPRSHAIVREKDIEPVLEEFERERERSIFHAKIVIDTTDSTPEQSVNELTAAIKGHLATEDRRRMADRKGLGAAQ